MAETPPQRTSPVLYRVLDCATHPYARIGVLSLNRPEARNALSRGLVDSLARRLAEIAADDRVRGVILDSATRGMFCAGADLVERRDMTAHQVDHFLRDLRRVFSDLSRLGVPTISVVDGHALGGGLELALCTDLRVVGAGARMGLPETRLGIIPGAGGTQRLTRLVGPARAKDLVYAARILDGREARETGIAEYFCPSSSSSSSSSATSGTEAFDRALALMETYVQNSPIGIRQAKAAIDFAAIEDGGIEAGLDRERSLYDVCMAGADRDEGLAAFKEKRKPVYGVPSGILSVKAKI